MTNTPEVALGTSPPTYSARRARFRGGRQLTNRVVRFVASWRGRYRQRLVTPHRTPSTRAVPLSSRTVQITQRDGQPPWVQF